MRQNGGVVQQQGFEALDRRSPVAGTRPGLPPRPEPTPAQLQEQLDQKHAKIVELYDSTLPRVHPDDPDYWNYVRRVQGVRHQMSRQYSKTQINEAVRNTYKETPDWPKHMMRLSSHTGYQFTPEDTQSMVKQAGDKAKPKTLRSTDPSGLRSSGVDPLTADQIKAVSGASSPLDDVGKGLSAIGRALH